MAVLYIVTGQCSFSPADNDAQGSPCIQRQYQSDILRPSGGQSRSRYDESVTREEIGYVERIRDRATGQARCAEQLLPPDSQSQSDGGLPQRNQEQCQ